MKLTILIPVYNEEQNIIPLYNRLIENINPVTKDYEIILINDGSRDKTRLIIEEIAKKDKNIKLINLRKNFGKADALSIGFKESKGDIIITMDGDLQDDPIEIPRFIEKINEGYDMVSGWKYKRHDPLSKTIPSRLFNGLTGIVSGLNIHDFNCGFKAYKKELTNNLHIYGELHRYIPALMHWEGYKIGEIKVRHHPRMHGKSKYGITRLFKGFFDLITLSYLGSFRNRPLHLFGGIGIICSLLGFTVGFYLLTEWLRGFSIGSRPLLTLSILLIVIGVQFISTGLIAETITSTTQENLERKIRR